MSSSPLLRCTLALAVAAVPASAALVETNTTLVVVAADPELSEFAVGDRFGLTFTLDDAVADVSASANTGSFPALVTAWSMSADPSNLGSWQPSGSANGPGGSYTSDAVADSLLFEIGGSGFPDGGPTSPWVGFGAVVAWPNGITDSGLGDTFAHQLGAPFGIPPGSLTLQILFEGDGGQFRIVELVVGSGPSPLEVPTISTIGLVLLGLLLLTAALRRIRESQP